MPTPTRSYRLSDEIQAAIAARSGPSTSQNAALASSLERYFYALYEARKGLEKLFTPGECGLIVDVLNGTIFNHYLAIQHVTSEVLEAMNDAGYAGKWGVSQVDLVDKLKMLDYLDKLALVDAVQVWWEATTSDNAYPHAELFTGHPDNKVAAQFTG